MRPVAGKVLVVLSAARHLPLGGGKVHETGYFLGELMEPLFLLREGGFDFDLATPGGAAPTVDPDSLRSIYWLGKRGARDEAKSFVESDPRLGRPLRLEDLSDGDLARYEGLFIPGGHAPMVDLPMSLPMGKVLRSFHDRAKPTGAICHGVAALLAARGDGPAWLYQGYRMTAFSKFEEKLAEPLFLGGKAPYYVDERLKEAGGIVETRLPFFGLSHAVRDRELVTGQNPHSAVAFARLLLETLKSSKTD